MNKTTNKEMEAKKTANNSMQESWRREAQAKVEAEQIMKKSLNTSIICMWVSILSALIALISLIITFIKK